MFAYKCSKYKPVVNIPPLYFVGPLRTLLQTHNAWENLFRELQFGRFSAYLSLSLVSGALLLTQMDSSCTTQTSHNLVTDASNLCTSQKRYYMFVIINLDIITC